MKRLVYSGFLKFVAVVLLIACVVLSVLTALDGALRFFNEKVEVYGFESDFSNSWVLASLLDEPEHAVYNAYEMAYRKDTEETTTPDLPTTDPPNLSVEEHIKRRLEMMHCAEQIDYYVKWNDKVFTNCDAVDAEQLMQREYYSYIERDADGYFSRRTDVARAGRPLIEEINEYDRTSTLIICCSVKEDVAAELRTTWERQESMVFDALGLTLAYAAGALLLLIYLLSVCGKNRKGEYQNMWLDYIPLELQLIFMAGTGIGAVVLLAYVLDEYVTGSFSEKLLYPVVGAVTALASLIMITALFSIVRNIKTKRLVASSIILQILKWVWRILATIVKWTYRAVKTLLGAMIRMLCKKSGVLPVVVLFLYTAVIGFLGVGTLITRHFSIWGVLLYLAAYMLIGVLLFLAVCAFLAFRSGELDQIKKGAREVRSGNVSYKIPQLSWPDMKELAANVNEVSRGLEQSVAAQVKAERMKSELITNVSHDLKTPITSIISYTQLLSDMEDLPEQARDYVAIIAKKSDRLKHLTQDLFDISKAQSGNEEIVMEKLDVALLLNQTLGEHDNEIQDSGLQFCVDATQELYVYADGRKMSRVIGNLIDNILKYSMKNTRVFICAAEKDGQVVVECKNISAYPLNFDTEEITQRFVRGDESRTEDGNGLGLAIAKSYTEMCGGTFEIVTDGDMFKARIKFPRLH